VQSPQDDYRTPGQLIQSLLHARGWTQRVLAVVLEMDETAVNRILSGKRPVSAETALALADVFAVPAERFLDLQKTYELAQAEIVFRRDPRRETRALLFGDLPISHMIQRGWIDAKGVRDVDRVESELTRFFGAESADEIEILPHAAKKTSLDSEVSPSQLAWIYRAKQIAGEMLVGRYSQQSVKASVKKLSALLSAPEEARKVPRILAEAGIRFVIVESVPGAKIDGVCFWLDDRSPVIGMSLRFDRIDNFWFVLRHELEHVIQGHGKSEIMVDAELEGARAGDGLDVPEVERIANVAAAEFCVPQTKLNRFISRKAPFFAERDFLGFCRTLQLHPGIAAGQLQHKTGRYDRFRKHQVKIRSCVSPGAIVDGWGDVAPV